jgi:hypothetical protein
MSRCCQRHATLKSSSCRDGAIALLEIAHGNVSRMKPCCSSYRRSRRPPLYLQQLYMRVAGRSARRPRLRRSDRGVSAHITLRARYLFDEWRDRRLMCVRLLVVERRRVGRRRLNGRQPGVVGLHKPVLARHDPALRIVEDPMQSWTAFRAGVAPLGALPDVDNRPFLLHATKPTALRSAPRPIDDSCSRPRMIWCVYSPLHADHD